MSQEKERVKEREVSPAKYLSEKESYMFSGRVPEKKHLRSLPRVIRTQDMVPIVLPTRHHDSEEGGQTEQQGQAGYHLYLDWQYNKWQDLKHPIYTMAVHGSSFGPQKKRLGRWGGGHRHWMEAVFYLYGGKGHEEQDGITYQWEGEGILCVPSYVYHKHFTDEQFPGDRERAFTVVSRNYENLGIADFEQIDISATWVTHFGGLPAWLGQRNEEMERIMRSLHSVTNWESGEPKTVYDRYLKRRVDENRWRVEAPRFVPFDSVPWEYTRQGKMKFLSHPWVDNCCLKTLDVYVQEIPPGGASGKHRHVGEEIIFILDGKGYDIQDGVRYDWEKDALVCVPLMTTHQHFNADPQKPAKIVSVMTRWYWYINQGGFQQLEDAPDYRG